MYGNSRKRGLHAGTPSASSPRVRGTQPNRLKLARYAPVHPRVYGELRKDGGQHERLHRFIPACTGNSRVCRERLAARPVHPREYGELNLGGRIRPCNSGSSPRVRGTPDRQAFGSLMVGSSPRVRGTQNPLATPMAANTVHPRVYGELRGESGKSSEFPGSSPRVRGTRPCRQRRPPPTRFIPACTGTPKEARNPRGRLRFIPACTGNSRSLLIFCTF